jgi:hypothetical protein
MQFRRWLQNENVNFEVFYLPLIEKVINVLSREPIVLIIDGSETAKNCVTLMVSVVYKGRALPLMWVTREGKKGHNLNKCTSNSYALFRKSFPKAAM